LRELSGWLVSFLGYGAIFRLTGVCGLMEIPVSQFM
jgi:hypothetical protein